MVIPVTPSRHDVAELFAGRGWSIAEETSGDGAAPRPPHLRWDGRWGRWSDDGVRVLAPCVADFDLEFSDGSDGVAAVTLSEATKEFCSQLNAALPRGGVLHCVADHGAIGRRQHIRAAISCDTEFGHSLASTWKARPLCAGRASATCTDTHDTGTQGHMERIREPWQDTAAGDLPDTVALELATHWALKGPLPMGSGASLTSDTHWHQFATVFGEVDKVELAWRSSSGSSVSIAEPAMLQLLVKFRCWSAARRMAELLAGRFLCFVSVRGPEIHEVTCLVGNIKRLRDKARNQPETQGSRVLPTTLLSALTGAAGIGVKDADGSFVYQLYRLHIGDGAPAADVCVTAQRPTAILGRDATCDLPIPCHHVSRHHAVLRLLADTPGSPPSVLFIEDKSTNGTWVNKRRLQNGQMVRLGEGDTVSFEAENDPNPPTYAVRRFFEETASASSEKSAAAAAAATAAAQAAAAAAVAASTVAALTAAAAPPQSGPGSTNGGRLVPMLPPVVDAPNGRSVPMLPPATVQNGVKRSNTDVASSSKRVPRLSKSTS